jgi:methyl-accepting chemotaxis protein
MNDIVDSVQRVSDIITEITAASSEQSVGIDEINRAIGQMDAVTQQNAALVEESAAAAESMQHQAHNLAQVVSVFKLNGQQASVSGMKGMQRPAAKTPQDALRIGRAA